MTSIQVNDLRKEYDVPSGTEVAVGGVDFEISDGKFVTIVGPSGCGKTTLLRCIAGLETPTAGEIHFGDEEVTDVIPQHRDVAMVFQDIALYTHMTAEENILYPLKIGGVDSDVKQQRLDQASDILQISPYLDKKPPELSGGQQQRVALARGLVQEPSVYLFDEPTSNLDAQLKVEVRKEIQRVANETDETMIYVTHDQEEALTMSDLIVVMDDGEIMQIGSPNEVYGDPNSTFVASFIGTPSMNLFDGRVDGDAVALRDVTEFDVPNSLADGEYTVGFRPSHIELTSGEGILSGTIQMIESLGHGRIIYLETAQGELRILDEDEDRPVTTGDEITIDVERDNVMFFDAETGDRVEGTTEAKVATNDRSD